MTTKTPETPIMEAMLEQHSPDFVTINPGEMITGRVISKGRGGILVDIGGVATGVISGRELVDTFQTAKDLQVGDEISAFILEAESEDGMVILSLRKAGQLKAWDYFEKVEKENGTIDVVAKEANKGGLMVEVGGVTAFLPVSQLAPHNYPRVDGANAAEILSKLQDLVGKKFTTAIILRDPEISKLVVSERAAGAKLRDAELEKLKIGDVVEGEINGLVKFGAFVIFGNLEGLVHISEMTWKHVKNPTELFKMGDKVTVKVIGIEGQKISLSIKQLEPDPWLDKIDTYPVGSVHNGVINKTTNFGVFVTLEEDVNGLVHTSEFTEEVDPEAAYKEGDEVTVKVLEVLNDDHSLKLSFKGVEQPKKSATKAAAKKEEVAEDTPDTSEESEKEEEKKTKKTAAKKKTSTKKTAAKKEEK